MLLKGLKKELLYFVRSRISLALVFLVPILTVAILGNVFNEKAASGIAVRICATEGSEIGDAYYSAFSKGPFSVSRDGSEGCSGRSEADISSGKLSAAIVVPNGIEGRISKGTGENVQAIYDNSKEDVSGLVLAYSSGATREISENISKSFISGAWEGLGKMGVELDIAGLELVQARGKLNSLILKVSEAREKLANATVDRISAKISEMDSFLDAQKASLLEANRTAASVSGKLESANATVDESLELLQESDALLEEDINSTKAIVSALEPFSDFFSPNNPACSAVSCPNVSIAEEVTAPLKERISKEEEMRRKILRISGNLTGVKAELAEAEKGARDAGTEIEGALQKLSDARASLLEMKGVLGEFSRERESALLELGNAETLFSDTLERLESTLPKIEEAKGTIIGISKRSPESVITPLGLERKEGFSSKGFSYIFPAIVAIVLMFNLMLVSANSVLFERKAGTFLRANISGRGAFHLLAPKIAVFGAIGLVQVAIMCAFGALAFSVEIGNFWQFFLASSAIAALFSLAGTAIGFLASDESGAILAVVGISIPSLFLSGGLNSFEFLPETLKEVSSRLPLAMSSSALRTAGVYGGNPELSWILAYCLGLSAVVAVLFRKKLE